MAKTRRHKRKVDLADRICEAVKELTAARASLDLMGAPMIVVGKDPSFKSTMCTMSNTD